MSIDIYAAIEYQTEAGWQLLMLPNSCWQPGDEEDEEAEFIPRLEIIERDYDLFAILANVRNRFGFHPISDSRGFPENVSSEVRMECLELHYPFNSTWVLLSEILRFDWTQSVTKDGYVNAETLVTWDRKSRPSLVCMGVPQDRKISEAEMRERIAQYGSPEYGRSKDIDPKLYCKVQWIESYAQSSQQLWTAVLPQMLPLGAEHGFDNVRLVMSFDQRELTVNTQVSEGNRGN